MEIVKKRLSELRPSEKNVRRHNQNQVKEFAKSIDAFGVIRPIICDENGVILCGHGLYAALQYKGFETADCVIMSGLNEKQKKKLMLADNKIYELATNDYDLIDSMLKDFGAEGDFSIPGYSAETLEDLYGIRSLEESAQQVQAVMYQQEDAPTSMEQPSEDEAPAPSQNVLAERAHAMQRKVIICPHCGGTIEL